MDSGYQGLLSYKTSNFNKKNENRENNREDRRRRDETIIFDIEFSRSTTFVKHLLSNSCEKDDFSIFNFGILDSWIFGFLDFRISVYTLGLHQDRVIG